MWKNEGENGRKLMRRKRKEIGGANPIGKKEENETSYFKISY